MVVFERNLYGHLLAGLLRERRVEEVELEEEDGGDTYQLVIDIMFIEHCNDTRPHTWTTETCGSWC